MNDDSVSFWDDLLNRLEQDLQGICHNPFNYDPWEPPESTPGPIPVALLPRAKKLLALYTEKQAQTASLLATLPAPSATQFQQPSNTVDLAL